MPETLIDAATLAEHVGDPDWAVVDCRHRLDDPGFGERAYREAHVAGAVFAHADRVIEAGEDDQDKVKSIVAKELGGESLPRSRRRRR